MKRCPQCNKTYADDTLNFCLEDGEWLVADGEPATAVLPEFGVPPSGGTIPNDDATRPQIYTTASEAEPQGNFGRLTERQSLSARRAAEPQNEIGSSGFDKRLLLAA